MNEKYDFPFLAAAANGYTGEQQQYNGRCEVGEGPTRVEGSSLPVKFALRQFYGDLTVRGVSDRGGGGGGGGSMHHGDGDVAR